MYRNIIVLDDFYSNPNEIREFALNSPYPDPGDECTYPGKNSGDNFYPDELHNRFEQILNRKLTPASLLVISESPDLLKIIVPYMIYLT